jgi:hypothetical protein
MSLYLSLIKYRRRKPNGWEKYQRVNHQETTAPWDLPMDAAKKPSATKRGVDFQCLRIDRFQQNLVGKEIFITGRAEVHKDQLASHIFHGSNESPLARQYDAGLLRPNRFNRFQRISSSHFSSLAVQCRLLLLPELTIASMSSPP